MPAGSGTEHAVVAGRLASAPDRCLALHPPALILGLGLALSLLLFQFARAAERRDAQQGFERRAGIIAQDIERDLIHRVQVVNQYRLGGEVLAIATDASLFASYANILRPQIQRTLGALPGLEAVQFVGAVPGEQREALEGVLRGLLVPDFQITDPGRDGLVPAAPRPYHAPIYLSDGPSGPLPAGGLDLARDPLQAEAFQRIGDSGETAAWPAGAWESTAADLRYRIAAPSYLSTEVPLTVAERRAALFTFSSLILRPQLFFSASLAGRNRQPIDLRVYDDALEDSEWPALIYTSAANERPWSDAGETDGLHWGTSVSLADRTWRLEFTPGAGYSRGGT